MFIGGLSAILLAVGIGRFCLYVNFLRSAGTGTSFPEQLTTEQQLEFSNAITTLYPQSILNPLPYQIAPVEFALNSQCAIMIDESNGCILYENNADLVIPPASLTKLVVMYVVFQEIDTGRISLDDIVPLPAESWAINAPPGSSLMFLAEGQIVTLRELMIGLAVASGNDAAVAVAHYVSGSVDAFIDRMNSEMKLLGLTQTHFVEPSGYSELNLTTPREFAAFARVYLERYPEALSDFHSIREISYPQEHNLPVRSSGKKGTQQTIRQETTNKSLDAIPGADGLKTGFIYESGYNLALTVKRNGTRIISVTMGGPGNNSRQGNQFRTEDALQLSDWAFAAFTTKPADKPVYKVIPVLYSNSSFITLTDAYSHTLTTPNLSDAEGNALPVIRSIIIPDVITELVSAGQPLGKIVYTQGDFVLEEVPLVADRTLVKANPVKRAIDALASLFI